MHTVIKTDAQRKTTGDSFIKYFTPHFICKVSKTVTQSLRVRGSWRPNITEIFWPQSYGRQHCVFLVLHGCSTGALESTALGAGFPYYFSSISTPTIQLVLNSTHLSASCSIRRPYITFNLSRLCNFFRYLATGMCHFRYLWNGLCDRHRAEITVMQFRGHSFPVHQSMRV